MRDEYCGNKKDWDDGWEGRQREEGSRRPAQQTTMMINNSDSQPLSLRLITSGKQQRGELKGRANNNLKNTASPINSAEVVTAFRDGH